METGFVKLYRKLLQNAIASNLELLGLVTALLLKANHKGNSFFIGTQKVTIKPGQFVSSQVKLSVEFGMTRAKMIRLLNTLESEDFVDIKGYSKYSLFTLKNRDKYQKADSKGTSNDTTNEHQTDTNKNDNNEKNDNNIIITKSNTEPRSDINNLIEKLKEKTNALGLAYDNEKERQFGKHILTAKEFGAFCDKLNMDRVTFSIAVLEASVKIGYWKGPATGPKKIYQEYAEIYNQTAKISQSKSNVLVI